ncbi:LytR C-terminal domain-containing protein [Sphingomonas sp.]|uniref:LytR C-terminal domain-containing protein n=1 Tax=Sphingomonas sp. TaxID=28214 RepID=UPI0025DC73D0|nr:LytR C-terminal domain-containing protein [Sphingomonas sp.]
MRLGTGIAFAAMVGALAGCAAKDSQVQVRAIADPASKLGVGSERVAEARGQLALGNVGLAIEAFHAALRDQPNDIDAMNGLAACYDAMGRSDLSRQYYEAALAVAPRNPTVLTAFAASAEAQGDRAQAAELRSEAAEASGSPASPPPSPDLAMAATSITIALPTARAEPLQVVEAAAAPDGPRLQRLSPGEVALLTGSEPAWRPQVVARTAQSVTVHWVALDDGAARPMVRLLNAARVQGLAARTRDYLVERGWRRVEIGDAYSVRASSIVLYPRDREAAGRSLAAQFGFRPGLSRQGQQIVVLLGRDARAGRGASARG